MANVSKLRLNGISYDIKDNNAREQLALIQNQINQLIAPSGEAPNPAQIQNARIGVDGVVYDTLGNAIRTQINNLNNIIINNGGGLSIDAKMALLTCFQKVAWIDDQGQIYYNALYNSLFPTAISISVIFNSASHVFYDTDTLNDLRPYLTVRATLPDNTTEIITNYSLRGSMTVGTNIITVQYQGLTDTFSVTVAADPAYITAVFTQPQTTIYTDDDLDDLKSDLVVTYYARPSSTGVVLSDSQYTLSGTLVSGTSTVIVTYGAYTDTFSVTNVTLSAVIGINKCGSGTYDYNSSITNAYCLSTPRDNRAVIVTQSNHPKLQTKTVNGLSPEGTSIYSPFKIPAGAVSITYSFPSNGWSKVSILEYDSSLNIYKRVVEIGNGRFTGGQDQTVNISSYNDGSYFVVPFANDAEQDITQVTMTINFS